ncbi:MAG: chorismate synthase [Lachnospiraceae bacterium]|nr:chorismate synthase [Lachnospiraceae bacterium]
MAGSSFGTIFRITTWGESHGKAIGVVIDGCPAGLPLCEEDIDRYTARRRPNGGPMSTARRETDKVQILSGVFEGKTTGTPISLMIMNEDQRSRDYSSIADSYRPGHADYGYDVKYGFRDYRGGGRSSARETAARVAAGAVAQKLLQLFGVECRAHLSAIGSVPSTDPAAMEELVQKCRSEMNSIGSTVICAVKGLPAGIGDPVFEKLDANLAKAIFSIGAVKGLDIGDGHLAATLLGSQNNDPFRIKDGKVVMETNHGGGILGGISTGSDILMTVYFKPTPSIALPQRSVNRFHEEIDMEIKGRHDPVIGARAAVVVESMVALTLVDAILLNQSARIDKVQI